MQKYYSCVVKIYGVNCEVRNHTANNKNEFINKVKQALGNFDLMEEHVLLLESVNPESNKTQTTAEIYIDEHVFTKDDLTFIVEGKEDFCLNLMSEFGANYSHQTKQVWFV